MFTWFKKNVLLQGRDKHFVSDIDRFLEKLNQKLPKSASQLAEIKKYQRIFAMRDKAIKQEQSLL